MAELGFRTICCLFACPLLFSCVALVQNDARGKFCGAENFDVQNLTSKIWRFSVPGSSCLNSSGGQTADECEITMAFCQTSQMGGSCKNSSVCESSTAFSDTYNLGTYIPDRNPFNTSALSSGVGFTVRYGPGERYVVSNKTNCTLQTVMTFFCNISAVWATNSSSIIPVPKKPSVQFVPGRDICLYNITFDFAGACPVTTPRNQGNLSPGSIMIMMFIVLVVLYFVMGCFINIVRGKTGEELIPHHQFWAVLPVYIMEGILFTLSCGGRRSKDTYERI